MDPALDSAFIAWLSANGATVSPSIALKDYSAEGAGRGVVALAAIEKDTQLFSIPRALLLSPETSALAQKMNLKELEGWNPLLLCMIYELGQGSNSHWKPYFDILPKEFSTPMFWSPDDLQDLAGTGVIDKIGKQEAESAFKETLWPLIKAHPELFPNAEEHVILEIFHRVGSLVMAYAFHDTLPDNDEEDSDGEDEEQEEKVNVSMVPMADMLNHKTGHNNARLFHEKDCLRMVAIKTIPANQQIYNTYGDLCNADLLRKYGFVDQPNPFNIAEISGESLVEKCTSTDDKGQEDKVEWLLENDGLEDFFILEADGEIPEELVGCAKILLMSLEEFQTTVLKGKKLPNTKLTVEVQKTLRELLEAKLQKYVSNAKEDKALLKQDPEALLRNKRNAVVVRSGEREIVQSVLEKVKKWRPPVPASAASKAKTPAKGQHPGKGKKPYQKK